MKSPVAMSNHVITLDGDTSHSLPTNLTYLAGSSAGHTLSECRAPRSSSLAHSNSETLDQKDNHTSHTLKAFFPPILTPRT